MSREYGGKFMCLRNRLVFGDALSYKENYMEIG